jgi:hypothetical protein
MTTEPRAALDRLIAALEAHLAAASRRQGEADTAVVAAYQTLADAFEEYDEALYDAFDEVTPFVLYDEAEDAAEDDDDEELDDLDELDDDDDDDDVLDELDDESDDDESDDESDDDELEDLDESELDGERTHH